MKSVYFSHKTITQMINPMKFLRLAESEYCTLYRNDKWDAPKEDPASAFYVENVRGNEDEGEDNNINYQRRRNRTDRGRGRGGGHGGCGGRGRGGHIGGLGNGNATGECHNCGKWENFTNCWLPMRGACEDVSCMSNVEEPLLFVDDRALRRPPVRTDARKRTLDNGLTVKWCSECEFWVNHVVVGHTATIAWGK